MRIYNLLDFRGVSFEYPKFSVRDVSFAVSGGECAALTGANGSGKTTVGKLAVGIIKPTAGCIFVGGENISGMSLGWIGARVGYLFQDPSRQLFAPTVLEDLMFPSVINGGDADAARETAMALLKRMGLEQLSGRSVFRLSGGEKQRLALAGLLIRRPRLLVLDEPTTGLDPDNRDFLENILRGYIGDGSSVLLITHDINFAERLNCKRLFITNGALV